MGRTIEQTLGYLFGLQRFEENPELDATIQKTLQRYPSLRSDGKVRKNETRPTRQEEHILAGPEQNTKSHNEQIEEIRKNTQPPFQPTDYTGLKLDNRLADQIAQQPAAELLTFERVGNKTRIQAKLPEKGRDPETGEEFNIRVNMNYFVRGIVTAVMDENGNLNSAKAIELDALRTDLMAAVVTNDQKEKDRLSRELIDKLKIPEEDRPDFERFFRANNKKANHLLVNGNTSPIKLMTEEIQKAAEADAILKAILPSDFVVLLDERGEMPTSVEWARNLEHKAAHLSKDLVFAVGGPYGFSEEVYERCNERLSLSKMTFSHQLVRLVFLEQLYRAMTIIKGEPYHHE